MLPQQHPGARHLHAEVDQRAEPAGDQPGRYYLIGESEGHRAALSEAAFLTGGHLRVIFMVAPSLPVLPVSSFRLPSVAGSEDGADGCATPETKLREVFAEPGS